MQNAMGVPARGHLLLVGAGEKLHLITIEPLRLQDISFTGKPESRECASEKSRGNMDFSGITFSELVRQFAWRGTEPQKQVWECCENQAQSLPTSLNHQSGKSCSSPLYINNLCLGKGKGGLGQTELLCCGLRCGRWGRCYSRDRM